MLNQFFLPLEQAFNFPRRLFAGTVIPPEALVQTLGVSEPPEEQSAEHPRGEAQTE